MMIKKYNLFSEIQEPQLLFSKCGSRTQVNKKDISLKLLRLFRPLHFINFYELHETKREEKSMYE